MIELIAAAMLQLAILTSDGSDITCTSTASAAAPTTTNTDGGAGNWDDGN